MRSFEDFLIKPEPCPAAGLDPKRPHRLSVQRRGEFTQVQCSCGMRGPNYRRLPDARAAWNKLTLKENP